MKHLWSIVVVGALMLGAVGCSQQKPCETLVTKMCEAGGKDACALLKRVQRNKPPSARDQSQCKAILGDSARLEKLTDQLRAVAAMKAASGAASAKPAPAAAPAKPAPAVAPAHPSAPAAPDAK